MATSGDFHTAIDSDIAVGAVKPALVPPVEPGGGREFDLVDGMPGTPASDQLGLVQTVDCLGEGVVIAIALRSGRVDWRNGLANSAKCAVVDSGLG
jgi:hypothetical protein